MKLTWEDVEDDLSGWMKRARVPGGWIYERTNDVPVMFPEMGLRYGHAWTTSMCFVPDVPNPDPEPC